MKGSFEKGYFHICTDGNSIPWIFQDDEDFIKGINRIGICIVKTSVIVIAFVLMDNHCHFILYGTMPECKRFITLYKRLTGIWILTKYAVSDYLRGLQTEIIRLESEENLLNAIAYIDRNPLIAGYRYMPGEYPWGSSRYMFRDRNFREDQAFTFDKAISSFTRREQKSILNSNVIVPSGWKVDKKGMLDPSSFTDISALENIFRSPMRYSYFLAKKLEGAVEQDFKHSQKTFIPDKELRPIVNQLIKEHYGVDSISKLGVSERLHIARKLRYNYASTLKQISRMVLLDKSALEGFI